MNNFQYLTLNCLHLFLKLQVYVPTGIYCNWIWCVCVYFSTEHAVIFLSIFIEKLINLIICPFMLDEQKRKIKKLNKLFELFMNGSYNTI